MTDRISPPIPGNVVDLLRQRAEDAGDSCLYRFLHQDEDFSVAGRGQGDVWTYAEMDQRARRVAGWLRGRVPVGGRVLIVFPTSLDFLAAYFGCLYAGVIAVPAHPPRATILGNSSEDRRSNPRTERLRAIVADADIHVALATSDWTAAVGKAGGSVPGLEQVSWHDLSSIDSAAADDWRPVPISGSTIAFLQYTSGSTGTPKGVMVRHRNVLHNQELVQASFRSGSADHMTGWLPMHHDMGLIGNVLHPLYLGSSLTFFSPIDFLQQPIRWLQAITKFGAIISGGPNFAYKLCADEISSEQLDRSGIDLSNWKVAFNGAEPIDADVLRRFAERFEKVGFQDRQFAPCYGMAETTLLVTSKVRGEELQFCSRSDAAGTSPWVACGSPDSSLDLRIVDPETKVERVGGQEGEIWVAGDTVTAGYWNRPEENEEIFAARIHGNEKTAYLRTGDLGLLKDGQLYITGRRKDLIIVAGANHYPQDLERTAEAAHPALAAAGTVAFGIESDDGEAVVLVCELRRTQRRSAEPQQVTDAVASAIAEHHGLTCAAIVLVRPGSVPKTTSGKLQRREAKRQFLAGEFRELARSSRTEKAKSQEQETFQPTKPEAATIRRWLVDRIAERLQLEPSSIDVHQPLAALGLNSIGAVRLAGQLSDWLSLQVPATIAYEFPTIASIAEHLSGSVLEKDAYSVSPKAPVQSAVAVVGIACRFPGANSPSEFWDLLVNGRDSIVSSAGPTQGRGFSFAKGAIDRAGYVNDVDQFDAAFFGISPREADAIDPQHRLLLELTQFACDDAGIPIDRLAGREVGVFVGVGNNDYSRLATSVMDAVPGQHDGYIATGSSMAMASNRLSYTFDFRGPSMTIDTACSSSLAATHQAMASLNRGECRYAVAGGVNLILSDHATRSFTAAGMLSPDGVCRPFADGANGFVRGEGGGVVLLRPLEDAIADGDRIYAVLAGSSSNQDGRTNGLTAPSRLAQTQLIRSALANAGWSPSEVDYIEAHGTGTELGDPIEMRGIAAAILEEPNSGRTRPLMVGSVKANIGHLEAAAGIAGLIKTCLAVQHGQIPKQIHHERPSQHIDWSQPVQVATTTTQWPVVEDRPLRAGVSSFGFGGTNVHVLVERSPVQIADSLPQTDALVAPLLVSAKSETGLVRLVEQLSTVSVDHSLRDVAYTLAAGRSHWRVRACRADGVWANSPSVATENSDAIESIRRVGWLVSVADTTPDVDFYFSGQGGCFRGVGSELLSTHDCFRKHFERVEAWHDELTSQSLREVLWGDDAYWTSTHIQPALFALQMVLVETWREIGVVPTRVLGHSLGEYAAACTAGVFSVRDGLKMVAARASLIAQLISGSNDSRNSSGMLAVFANVAETESHLAGFTDRWEIAAVNTERQTVISAPHDTIERMMEYLRHRSVTTRKMQTAHGFHSWLVEPILDQFSRAIADVKLSPPSLRFISSQTGKAEQELVASPKYWIGNLRSPVRFLDGLHFIAGDRHSDSSSRIGLEIGAGGTLASLTRSAKLGLEVLPGLANGSNQSLQFAETVGQLYLRGVDLNGRAAIGFQGSRIVLPSTPMDRHRHWLTRPATVSVPSSLIRTDAGPAEELPGTRLNVATDAVVFQTSFTSDSYLREHRVGNAIVVPAATMLQWAHSALASVMPSSGKVQSGNISNFQIQRPLVIDENSSATCQMVLQPVDEGFSHRCKIVSLDAGVWRTHATFLAGHDDPISDAMTGFNAADWRQVDLEGLRKQFEDAGMQYGPSFGGLVDLKSNGNRAHGRVRVDSSLSSNGFSLHPVVLDACLQAIAATGSRLGVDRFSDRAWMPVAVQRVDWSGGDRQMEGEVLVSVSLRADGLESDIAVADIRIDDHENLGSTFPRMTLTGLELRPTSPLSVQGCLTEEIWVPQIRSLEPISDRRSVDSKAAEKALMARRDQRVDEGSSVETQEILDRLELAAGQWTVRIASQLGFPWKLGDRFDAELMADQLGIHRKHRRLWRRMLGILSEQSLLHAVGTMWEVIGDPDTVLAKPPIARPVSGEAGYCEFVLLDRCAEALPGVMRSGADPLPLLFPSDGQVSAADVYRDSAGGRRLNELVRDAVAELVQQLPPGRGIRVLEVGAGTGATTRHVMASLPEGRSSYVFTDVSPSFLKHARDHFDDFESFETRVLNIEEDPAGQGFENDLGTYDLIVAANVLHATRDMNVALRHVRQLVHPSGRIIVAEGVAPGRWLDLTFGLTPGWWSSEDVVRPDGYPLISVDRWRDLLHATGFTAIHTVDPIRCVNAKRCPSTLIVADAHESDSMIGYPPLDVIGSNAAAAMLRRRLCHVGVSERNSDVIHAMMLQDESLNDFQSLDQLRQTVQSLLHHWAGQSVRFWWASRGQGGGCDGFVRTLMLEQPSWQCTIIHADPTLTDEAWMQVLADEWTASILSPGGVHEPEIRFVDGVRQVRRLEVADHWTHDRNDLNETLRVHRPGTLRGVSLAAEPRRAPAQGEVEIEVRAAGLNFRDVLIALGQYPGNPPLGAECAGVVRRVGPGAVRCGGRPIVEGDRVLAITGDSLAKFVTVPSSSVALLPEMIDFEDASTLPVVFLTASLALQRLGSLSAGQTVLIHAAAGGVGSAAIQVAHSLGVRVIATASVGKHEHVRSLGVADVLDSRRAGFGKQVLQLTDGRGVDLVLNSLGPAMVADNLLSLAEGGRYVDIALANPQVASEIASSGKQIEYHWFDLSQQLAESNETIGDQLRSLLREVERGAVRPITKQVFSLSDAVPAMRVLRDGQNIGKVVIVPEQDTARELSRSRFDSNSVYVLSGGAGGLGLLAADWMCRQGARHLTILTRREPSESQTQSLDTIRLSGMQIDVRVVDVADAEALERELSLIRESGLPIAGVMQLAGTLDDAAISDQTRESLETTWNPKAVGAWNLHQATLHDPLDHFVLFSSASGWLGSPGQCNHAAANAAMDALALHRRSLNLPAVSIAWGPWSQIGAAATRTAIGRGGLSGIEAISPAEGMRMLDRIFAHQENLPSSVGAVRLILGELPERFRSRTLLDRLKLIHDVTTDTVNWSEFRSRLTDMSVGERRDAIIDHVRNLIAASLSLRSPQQIGIDQPLFDLGMDSLTSLELVNSLQSSLGVTISTVELFNHPNVRALAGRLLNLMTLDEGIQMSNHVGTNGHAKQSNAAEPSNAVASLQLPHSSQAEMADLLREIGNLSEQISTWETSR